MRRRSVASLTAVWMLGLWLVPAEPAFAADDEDLRQRLTEREDRARPSNPWHTDLMGRALTLSGEYELGLGAHRRRVIGGGVPEPDRLLLEQSLEVEAFYSFGTPLSLFAQLRLESAEDLHGRSFEEVSEYFVERGEMWLYSEDIAGSNVDLDLGRLHFEDERRWWWDEDLDAVRVAYEAEELVLTVAVGRELARSRFDHDFVEPEHERVLRVFSELAWDWSDHHGLELFLLHHEDRSRSEPAGRIVRMEREDESDARLTWVGARLLGAVGLRSRGLLGYWLDLALVHGDERLLELEALSERRSVVQQSLRRDVRGWAVDAGAHWHLPLPLDPRVFGGVALGSGDSRPEAGTDRAFRQTGLQTNEAGFGGVERFPHYGVLLEPELSNLAVGTAGAGISLLRSSSLDLVYHYYRQMQPAASFRDARIEATLTGRHHDLGHGLDLVLALEEWTHVELEFLASAFRAGRAFGTEHGTWSYRGFAAIRLKF